MDYCLAGDDGGAAIWNGRADLDLDGDGTLAGAIYVPVALMVPSAAFPPATPFTFQMTPVLLVFLTVAVNRRLLSTRTLTLIGEIVMVTGGGGLVMVTAALPIAKGTALLVACMVTVAGEGTATGAA